MAANPEALPASSITSIVMSALAVEAFINELAEAADMVIIGREGVASAALDQLRDFANVLEEVEDDRGSVTLKYQVGYQVLSGKTFPPGGQPFQEFKQLITLRNLLVHLKPGDRYSTTGHIEPKQRLIREFQQKGYTRTRPRRTGDPLGGISWLQEIQTVKMAEWAYRVARSIISAVGEAIPTDQPRTSATDMYKRASQEIPV
jgi:hypothetical protein